MTDARYPERWLYDRRLLHLSDGAHRLFMVALVWSVANRTDGVLHPEDVAVLPRVNPGYATDLETAGLWRRAGDSVQIVDFTDTQTSRQELEILANLRRREREKKARKRAAAAAAATSTDTAVPGDIPGGQSRGMSGRTALGQGQGQGEEVQDPRKTATNLGDEHNFTCPCAECEIDRAWERERAETNR